MKKIIFFILILIFAFFSFSFVSAQEQKKPEAHFFYSPTCPHCEEEGKFLDGLLEKYPTLEIKRHNIFEKESAILLKKFYGDYNVPLKVQGWVPIIFIGEEYFLGFSEQVGKNITECVANLINKEIPCEPQNPDGAPATPVIPEGEISLPLIGKINISNFSPLTITVIM